MKNKNKNRIFRFNRRQRGQTNYKKRLELLKSNFVRVVIRKSNNGFLVQFVEYNKGQDKVISSARAVDLKKLGFTAHTSNLSAAYLTGALAAKRASLKKFDGKCILDLGLQNKDYGTRIYSGAKGVFDINNNLKIKEDVFPKEDRIKGKHLKNDFSKEFDKIFEKIKNLK